MSDRDVIAETIAAHALYYDEYGPHIHVCACGWHVPDELEEEYLDGNVAKFTLAHAAHVAAALREARTVRSVEELDALPEGTLIAHGGYVLRNRDFCGWWRQVQRLDGGLCNGYDVDQDQITFPALILWHPKDGAL